jgi:hypothetical protein
MRPRFQADEDLNAKVISGLLRRESSLDIRTAKAAGIPGLEDSQVFAAAARDGRILVSHDRETMPGYFKIFVSEFTSAGLIIVSQTLEIREVIGQILLVWAASDAREWRDQITYLPL